MRIAKTIILTNEERITLMRWSRGRKTPARLVLRARIVLAAAAGQENKDIAAELKCTRRTAGTWRSRFAEGRLEALLKDAPSPQMPVPISRRLEISVVNLQDG